MVGPMNSARHLEFRRDLLCKTVVVFDRLFFKIIAPYFLFSFPCISSLMAQRFDKNSTGKAKLAMLIFLDEHIFHFTQIFFLVQTLSILDEKIKKWQMQY